MKEGKALSSEITIAFSATQLVLTLIGNILVCLAFYKVKPLRTPANLLLMSLAVADLCFAVVFMVNIVEKSVTVTEMNFACVLRKYVYNTLNVVVLWNLAAISLDRLLAIKNPLRYKEIFTKRRAMLAVLVLWVIAVVLALLPSILMLRKIEKKNSADQQEFAALLFGRITCGRNNTSHGPKGGESGNKRSQMFIKGFFLRVFPLVLPYIILFVAYTWIFIIAWRHYRREKRQIAAVCPERKLQMKFAKTSAIVMSSFILLFSPLLVLAITKMFFKPKHIKLNALMFANIIASNSAWLNPPIYAWRNRDFRKAFRKLLRPLCVSSCNGPTLPLRKDNDFAHRPTGTES